jgi:hypothetical protein
VREPAEYTALHDIMVNGVRGYSEGANVSAHVVENAGLVVGEDVVPAGPNVVPRPDENAGLQEWRVYAMGQGIPAEELDDMTRNDIRDRFPVEDESGGEPAMEPMVTPRPPRNAAKDSWIDYAVGYGMSRADAESRTKADLIREFGTDEDRASADEEPEE